MPHHGSENAYEHGLWSTLVEEKVALLATSPYNKGKNILPTHDMVKTICQFSPNFHITSDPYKVREIKHKHEVRKFISGLDKSIKKIPFEFGHIRIRKIISEEKTEFTIENFDAGEKVLCSQF